MRCPSCDAENEAAAEVCFTCGKALYALTQGVVLVSRYEVLSPLGKGGMGRVYKAFDRVLQEPVAIKVLRPELTGDPEMAARFLSEIKLARKVSHRNVCRIHEYGEEGRVAFLSMEFIDGVTLGEHLDQHPVSPGEAFELALQIAAGLEAIHEQGIVHRDFKPSNVMLDARGVAKIMDFGIAKQVASGSTGTMGSGVIGTPEYMSPEQGSGGKLDARGDVYSLGCVVYELFAGRPPFRGDTPLATLYLHQQEPPPLESPRLPAPLVPVLDKALAKDAAARYASVGEFADALRRARETWDGAPGPEPGAAPAPRPMETTTIPPSVRPHRRRWLSAALPWAGAALAAVALALALRYGGAEAPASPSPDPASGAAVDEAPERPDDRQDRAPRAEPKPDATPTTEPQPASPQDVDEQTPAGPEATPSPPSDATPAPTAPAPPLIDPADPMGLLTVLVIPAAEIEVDGESLGVATQRELRLTPGPHVVRILHPDYQPLQRTVHVRAGTASTLVLDLAEKAIRKSR